MDDFGSGHSSLNVLSELPVDVLKLDMKFLQEGSSSKKSILGFVISLSKWLNLKTVAEGVETKQQLVALKRFGCDYVQGYYYAKPMNRQEFEVYMEEHARKEEDKREYLTAEFQEPAIIGRREETILIAEDSDLMALKLGADRFIGKPYQQSLLLLSIQNMIKWKKVSKSNKKK